MDSRGQTLARQALNALPDARLVLNKNRSMVALYTAARDQQGNVHGVLGDNIEGASVVILKTSDLSPIREIWLRDENVIFKGLSSMWTDLDKDGEEEILTTVSDSQVGAAIFAFDLNGLVVTRSDPIGRGHRWRHQLVVAKFGPEDRPELAAVHTPHLGQMVEFFQKDGDRLKIVAVRPGYTSHIFGSRNLDMALAGDFDGDGKPEMVVPSNSWYRIVGLRHLRDPISHKDFVKEMWEFWLGQKVTSNLAAVKLDGGSLGLGGRTRRRESSCYYA